jgi:hypothetical protein
MTALLTHVYRSGEVHRFAAEGQDFIYLVSAGAIFALDGAVAQVLSMRWCRLWSMRARAMPMPRIWCGNCVWPV